MLKYKILGQTCKVWGQTRKVWGLTQPWWGELRMENLNSLWGETGITPLTSQRKVVLLHVFLIRSTTEITTNIF